MHSWLLRTLLFSLRIVFPSDVLKSTMQRTMKAGAKGIKTSVSGRLGGADMARTEEFYEGVASDTSCRYRLWLCGSDAHMVKLVLGHGSTMVRFFRQKELRKGAINNVNAKSKTS